MDRASIRHGKFNIRQKLTLSNWLVAVIPVICIFVAVSAVFLSAMTENERKQAQADVDKACADADLWLSQAGEVLSVLCLDINTQNAMGSYEGANLKGRLDYRDFFRNRLVGIYTSDMQMINAAIYLKSVQKTFSLDYRDEDIAKALGGESWFWDVLSEKQGSYVGFGAGLSGEGRVIRLARSIRNIRSGRILGMAYVELSVERLKRCFEPLVTQRGSLVELGEELTLGNGDEKRARNTTLGRIESLNLPVTCRISSEELARASAFALAWFVAGLAVLMLLIYRIDKRLADSFTKRILLQVQATRRMARGELDISLNDSADDEIGELSRSLERTARDMKRLIDEKYVLEIRRQQASLHALQSQINPHFIFNTLERISMLALIHDQYEIVNIAQPFSAMMRYAIAPSGSVPVEEEIDNVKRYLAIQQSRYEQPIHVVYDLPRHSALTLPRLTLQPLVENAFRHGFDQRSGGEMRLCIRAEETSAGVMITVANSGLPIPPERIAEIERLLEIPLGEETQDCFALRNIYQRIALIYGDEATLTLRSEQGETSVCLWLPKRKEDAHELSGTDL
ncbi:MAG: sensor histidine kinase [Clostridia bacterium]|nr:sensor histidine kinase [Clostridia bacterium]